MEVDFFNFAYAGEEIQQSWKQAVSDVINSGLFVGGNQVRRFEEEFALKSGASFAVGVSNGFDGLELALRALGIGHGDLVAVPAHTFIASWNAILACGAKPIGIDVGEDAQIDLDYLEDVLLTKPISCVMPVHMHGHVANVEELYSLKKRFEFKLVEDASQAHFASRGKTKVGSLADAAVFSLYPTKNLGALGDAGVVITNDSRVAEKIRKLSSYGSDSEQKYLHTEVGFNKRLDAIQAAVLINNLRHIDTWNETRRLLSTHYSQALDDYNIPYLKGRQGSVWHHFCIFSERRTELIQYLFAQSIGTEIHYPNLASNEVTEFLKLEKEFFPQSEKISKTILSLPLSQFHTEEMIQYVISRLLEAKKRGLV